jgi:hypothetical protein
MEHEPTTERELLLALHQQIRIAEATAKAVANLLDVQSTAHHAVNVVREGLHLAEAVVYEALPGG